MRGVAVVAAAALAAGVAGCGTESDRVEIEPGVDRPSTSSSSSPTKDPDLAAAEAKAIEFMDMIAALATDPKRPIDELSVVARGRASSMMKRSLAEGRAEGLTATGRYTYRDGTVTVVQGRERPAAEVRMCVDASKYFIKRGGKRVEPPKYTTRGTYTVEKWGDGTWYVTSQELLPEDC